MESDVEGAWREMTNGEEWDGVKIIVVSPSGNTAVAITKVNGTSLGV